MCCQGACDGVGGPTTAWRAAAALTLAVALCMRSAGRGGSSEEVEDVDEHEDQEEVVVLGDVGCAAMLGGAALWAVTASAAASVGGWRASRRAAGWGRVAGGARP